MRVTSRAVLTAVLLTACAIGQTYYERTVNASALVSDGGSAWMYSLPTFGTPGDSSAFAAISTLKLYENGIEMGPAHALHADIRTYGGGRYSHWDSGGGVALRFSATDSTNPRTNGRRYTYRLFGPVPRAFINPQNPAAYGADPTGVKDSTSAFQSAVRAGDLHIPAGTWRIDAAREFRGPITVPSNRLILCDPGAIIVQTAFVSQGTVFEIPNGNVGVFFCAFRGPNYNRAKPAYQNYSQGFVHMTGANAFNVQVVGNDFNGSGGYTGAVDAYASGGTPPSNLLVSWNSFSHCDYYAMQGTSLANSRFDHNSLTDCSGWIEADQAGVQVNAGNVADSNHVYFPNGTGNAQQNGEGFWANFFTCGTNASGTPFDYSGNTCTNNVVTGRVSCAMEQFANPGGVPAQYSGNTVGGSCVLMTRYP